MKKTENELIDNMNLLLDHFVQKRHDDHKDRVEWNRTFPPDVEVDVTEDVGMTITYGIWKTHDGVFLIAKSKNGYHPEMRISLSKKVVKAIRSLEI